RVECSEKRGELPNLDAIGRGEIKLVGGLNVEGGVPGVEIADRVGAVFAGRVRVGEDLLAKGGFASLLRAVLGVGEEKLLVASKAVDHGRGLAVERSVERV